MKVLVLVIFVGASFKALSQKDIRLNSPNKKIEFGFHLSNGSAFYNVSFKNKPLNRNSAISLSFPETGEFRMNLKAQKPLLRNGEEDYELITGKSKWVHQPYHEAIIPVEETKPPLRRINFAVRVFDDGVAFRYEFPEQPRWLQFSLTNENTTFSLEGDPNVLALLLPNYTSSHEGEYTSLPFSKIKEDTLMDMPTLFEFAGPVYMAITEVNLFDYASM